VKNLFPSISALLLATTAAQAAPNVQTNQPAPVSVFLLPANPHQGCDPFFPESIRPYESAMASPKHAADISSLVIKGFLGTAAQPVVIINDHAFAPGDDGDILTPEGRVHLHCLQIQDQTVVIEVNGQSHELHYQSP
jgi:hypothetical protein